MKERIALVIPTMKSGGAERVLSELANQWANQNIDVHLILLANTEKFYQVDSKITIHQLGFKNIGGKGRKFISEIKTFCQLRQLLKELSPNAVLSFMTKYNVFTIMASVGLKLNLFVSDRSNPYKKLPLIISQLRKYLYPVTTGIIAQTEEAKKVLRKLTGHKNIHVIPNPVRDVKVFPDVQREKIIVNMGRMVPEKGQKYLLEAFSLIKNHDWKLVILGDGPLSKKLEKQIQELRISENVFLPGLVNNVDEWLAKSSIFVFSSVSEGFPN
ncbi:MAG: glycosyltransferase, partial [Candidatus Paceibacterota bacterium]